MVTNQNKMKVSAFQADRAQSRHFAGRISYIAHTYGTSMLVKIGVCCAAAALVLLIKISSENKQSPMTTLENTVVTNEEELDDQLGKLKFVELPGIIEVFSSSDRDMIRLEIASCELIQDNTLLKLVSKEDQTVFIQADCVVKKTGNDPLYGAFAVLDMGDDTELTVYGLSEFSIEEGQPLSSGDELGGILAKMTFYASVKTAGRPVDPAAYLHMDAEQ